MVVDAQVGVVPLLEERLPQHPGSEAVGVEDQLHRDPLPGPAAAGLPPDVDRLLLRVGESRHGPDTPADVLPGVGANVRAQVRPDRVVVVAAVLHQRERDVVGDGVGTVQQRRPGPADLGTKIVVDDLLASAEDLLRCGLPRGSHESRFPLSAQLSHPEQPIRGNLHEVFCALRPYLFLCAPTKVVHTTSHICDIAHLRREIREPTS